MKKIFSKISHYTFYFLLFAAAPALAAVETEQDVLRILDRLVNWMFTFLLITATIFIIIAAYNYLFAAGDQEKVKKAHLMIVYAVVAIAVGLLARSVEFIVRQLVEQPASSRPSTETRGPYKTTIPMPGD